MRLHVSVSLVALCFASLSGILAVEPLPDPLATLFGEKRDLRLLTHADLGSWRQGIRPDEVKAIAHGDSNGDGIRDLAAVVVRTRGDSKSYAVVAFHGRQGGYSPEPHWV